MSPTSIQVLVYALEASSFHLTSLYAEYFIQLWEQEEKHIFDF